MERKTIIRGGVIFDSITDTPYRGAVIIEKNKIAAVVKDSDGSEYAGADATIIEAAGGLVVPGFHDNHVHLLMAGMFQEYVNLIDCRSKEEVAKLVWDTYKDSADKSGWVIGFQWYHVFWDEPVMPTKETLDAYFPDRPVFLLNAEAHGGWVNSKALEICGITRDTPDPFGGIIGRDELGEPTGVLYENATALVTKFALEFEPEREKQLIRSFMKGAAAYGITSVTDVQPYFHGNMGDLSLYSGLDRAGELSVRIHAAPDLLGDLDQVLESQAKYGSEKLTVNHVKQFIDGVPTTHTGLMLEDYANGPGERGIALFDLEAIGRAVPEAHRRGLSVKLHSCGDRSARIALDFFADAIAKYGRNHCRHAIEHCELVSEEDIPRFGELGVIPSVQPEHLALTQNFSEDPYPETLGLERSSRTWSFRKLLDSAGVLALGSDCPVVDPNPALEIYRGLTRLHNDGMPIGGWNPTQKLTLSELLRFYTFGSAYAVLREHEIGTIAPGNFADLAILDRNLFEVSDDEIKEMKTVCTIFDGNVVYEG